jgi:hypothetical protein
MPDGLARTATPPARNDDGLQNWWIEAAAAKKVGSLQSAAELDSRAGGGSAAVPRRGTRHGTEHRGRGVRKSGLISYRVPEVRRRRFDPTTSDKNEIILIYATINLVFSR